jgi:hypothetical protein
MPSKHGTGACEQAGKERAERASATTPDDIGRDAAGEERKCERGQREGEPAEAESKNDGNKESEQHSVLRDFTD